MYRERDQEPGFSPLTRDAPPDAEFRPASLPVPLPVASAPGPERPTKIRITRRIAITAALVATALVAGGWYGTYWWTSGRFMVATDDAYVRAHNTTLAAKIPGYLGSVLIEDNAQVRAGDLIATIDDGDYRLAADAAREKVSTQQA